MLACLVFTYKKVGFGLINVRISGSEGFKAKV